MAVDTAIVNCFRCYVEDCDVSHRIVLRDVSQNKSVFIRFGLILRKYSEMSGQDVNFKSHKFWILNQRMKGFVRINSDGYLIRNAAKIVMYPKNCPKSVKTYSKVNQKFNSLTKKQSNSREGIKRSLALIQTIDVLIKSRKCFMWRSVSKEMRLKGYTKIGSFREEFYSLLSQLWDYLRLISFNTKRDSIKNKTPELFRRILKINLKLFVSRKRFQWINDKKRMIDVKETVDWLLIQTTRASKDCDYRQTHVVSNSKRRRAVKSSTNSRPKSDPKRNNEKHIPRDKFAIDSIDTKIVSVIHKLEVEGQTYFDWPTIRHEMSAGADFFDSQLLKYRFKRLISAYVSVLGRFVFESDAINEWSLFKKFSKLDLRPFCDQITYQKIQLLRAGMSSELDTISVGTQTSSQNTSRYKKHLKSDRKNYFK